MRENQLQPSCFFRRFDNNKLTSKYISQAKGFKTAMHPMSLYYSTTFFAIEVSITNIELGKVKNMGKIMYYSKNFSLN